MGWRERDRMPELFVEAVLKLQPGELSDILRSPAGFHILKLNERRGGGGSFIVEQARVRHILARVNELVSETEARRKITLVRQCLAEGANFAEPAGTNSDDPGSAPPGGEPGLVVPGALGPGVEAATDAP